LNTYDKKVGRRCDLYLYFFFKGFELLNSKGSMVFISSNSWLDVDYGKYLQEALLTKAELLYVIDNSAKRSFEESEINTVISAIRKRSRSDEILSGETSFVVFSKPFENVIKPTNMKKALLRSNVDFRTIHVGNEPLNISSQENPRVLTVSRKSLWKLGGGDIKEPLVKVNLDESKRSFILSGNYSGDKWGKFLRGPDILFRFLSNDKLVFLRKVADVEFGAHTHLDEFFMLDKQKAQKLKIEKKYLQKIIRGISSISKPILDPKDLDQYLFVCRVTKKELRKKGHTQALKYINWGEKQTAKIRQQRKKKIRYPEVSGVKKNQPGWWSLGEKDSRAVKVFFLYAWSTYLRCPYSIKPIPVNATFHRVSPHKSYDPELIAALLNCSTTFLQVYSFGRWNLGLGVVKFEKKDLKEHFRIPDPNCIPDETRKDLIQTFRELGKRNWKSIFDELGATSISKIDLKNVNQDRLTLDKIVFCDILGHDEKDLLALYRAIIRYAKQRIEKARSF